MVNHHHPESSSNPRFQVPPQTQAELKKLALEFLQNFANELKSIPTKEFAKDLIIELAEKAKQKVNPFTENELEWAKRTKKILEKSKKEAQEEKNKEYMEQVKLNASKIFAAIALRHHLESVKEKINQQNITTGSLFEKYAIPEIKGAANVETGEEEEEEKEEEKVGWFGWFEGFGNKERFKREREEEEPADVNLDHFESGEENENSGEEDKKAIEKERNLLRRKAGIPRPQDPIVAMRLRLY
jgi:hypothetical protein